MALGLFYDKNETFRVKKEKQSLEYHKFIRISKLFEISANCGL